MAGGHKPGPSDRPKKAQDKPPTLAFTSPVLEDRIDGFPQTSERLQESLRKHLAACEVRVNGASMNCAPDESGIMRYVSLPLEDTIRGAWKLTVSDMEFFLGRTDTSWFVLYAFPAESIYDRDPRFMSINFKNKDKLVLPKGKTLYLSRVTCGEVDALRALAALSAGKMAVKADTLAPGPQGHFTYEDVRAKLAKASDLHSTDLFFDMREFIQGIRFITVEEDRQGNVHYYIMSGEDETGYRLYVNPVDLSMPGHGNSTRFRYRQDVCILYRED